MLAFACGEKFTGVEAPVAGAGSASAGDGDGGAEPNPSDGGRAGKQAGGGGGSAGRGGAPSVAGSAGGMQMPADGGEAGAGGQPVEAPPVPSNGLEVWLRADEGVSKLVTGAVTSWTDVSGHQRNAGQSALNFQPLLKQDALAGRPALVFDGVDDFLELPALDIDFAAGVSLFIVMRQESTGNCNPYFEASTDAEMSDLHFGNWMDSFNYEVEEDTVNDTQYPVVLQQPQIAVAIQGADGWVHLRRNANGAGERKIRLPPRVERTKVFIGKTLYSSCSSFDGSIGELLLYSRGLPDPELLQVEQYLQQKWGCCGGDP